MSTLSKTMVDLTKLEKSLDSTVKSLLTTQGKSSSLKLVESLKKEVSTSFQKLPSGDTSISKVRRALATVLNTLNGMLEGIQDGDMSRSEFKQAITRLKTKFIPQFKESLDGLSKKANAARGRLNDYGLLHQASAVEEELEKVNDDLSRLTTILKTNLNKEVNVSQVTIAIQNRIDLVKTVYGQLPSSPSLDEVADTLIGIYQALTRILNAVERNKKIPNKDFATLTQLRYKDLTDDIKKLHRLVVNDLLTFATPGDAKDYDQVPRKTIAQVLKKKADAPDDDDEVEVRNENDHAKERIAKVKAKRADLPKKIDGPYSLVRAPVVAIFDSNDRGKGRSDRPLSTGTVTQNFNKHALLDQYGIDYQLVEDYLILNNQTLLAVSRKAVQEAVLASLDAPAAKRAEKKIAATKQAKKEKLKSRVDGTETPEQKAAAERTVREAFRNTKISDKYAVDYATQVIALLNERGSRRYSLVSPTFTANPRNTDILLFWVMPASTLDALIRRGWNKLSQWSLPFDN